MTHAWSWADYRKQHGEPAKIGGRPNAKPTVPVEQLMIIVPEAACASVVGKTV